MARSTIATSSCASSGARRPGRLPGAEIEFLDVRAPAEAFGRPFHDHLPGLHHIAEIGDLQRHPGVLFDQQDGDAALQVQPADDDEYVAHHNRRKAQRRLVEQHDPGPRHQPAGNCQHLLLATRQRPGGLAKPPFQGREIGEDRIHVAGHVRVPAGIGAHREVFRDAQQREHLPPFGHVDQPLADDAVGRAALDGFASQPDFALLRVNDAGDGAQQRRLAGPVGAEHRDRASRADVEAHAADRHDRAVEAFQVANFEQGVGHGIAMSAPR